jgi:hypothetical protein
VGAHEGNPLWSEHYPCIPGWQAIPAESHVAAPMVALGHSTFDQISLLQNMEMMGEKIAGHADDLT